MRTLILSLSVLVFSGFLSTAMATKIVAPRDFMVNSPNGKYTLKVTAKSGVHKLCEGDKTLWQFQQEVWHNDYFVSDDGKYVLWVAWEYVKEGEVTKPAIVVFSAEGKAVTKTYAEVSNPRHYKDNEIGPIGDFWRIWRGEIKRDGEVVSIEVAGKGKIAIDLSDLSKSTKEG